MTANGDTENQESMASIRVAATAVDSRLASQLPVFKRAEQAEDALSADAKRTIAATTTLGVNTSLSRKVMKAADGRDYFLVAGNNAVSLVNDAGVGMTDDIEHALSGEAVAFQDCVGPNGARIVGLLPPGASGPKIINADGSEQPLAATSGVYVHLFEKVAGGKVPQYVAFTEAGTARRVELPVPDDLLATRCADPDAPVPTPGS